MSGDFIAVQFRESSFPACLIAMPDCNTLVFLSPLIGHMGKTAGDKHLFRNTNGVGRMQDVT